LSPISVAKDAKMPPTAAVARSNANDLAELLPITGAILAAPESW